MNLEQMKKDQLQARKEKNTVVTNLLTTLLAEIIKVGKNENREPTQDEFVSTVKKFIKTNDEYLSVNPDAKVKEALLVEKSILESYLPKQLTELELVEIVNAAINSGVNKDKGSIMKHMKSNFNGSYDGKLLSEVVNGIL